MKKFLAVFCVAMAATTQAQALCVSERDIVRTTPSNDGRLLTLHMRDGRVLVNHLQGVCSDLRFNGFAWVLHGADSICENMQSLRVLQSGQTCVLGKFDPAKTSEPHAPETKAP